MRCHGRGCRVHGPGTPRGTAKDGVGWRLKGDVSRCTPTTDKVEWEIKAETRLDMT